MAELIMTEESGTPSTPGSNKWTAFFKSDGLYVLDDAGAETGPFRIEKGLYNYLVNGGFDFAQRQVPGTLTTIATNTYSADRWRVARENADVQYQRNDATGESGLTSRYYGTFKKITNTGKFHIVQFLEGINSVPLRSKTIIFQFKLKASASKTIRAAVLELQNAGTIDTIPGTLITAFGANTVDPTLGANLAIITGAQSKSVTTSWQSFSVSVTVPSNSKNIGVALWTDSQFAANDTLSVAEAGLFIGATIQPWTPRHVEAELYLCRRHYEKSYAIDVAVATNTDNGAVGGIASGTANIFGFTFKAVKRATPTVTIYSGDGTINKISIFSSGADIGTTCTGTFMTEDRVAFVNDSGSGLTSGVGYYHHYTAESEL